MYNKINRKHIKMLSILLSLAFVFLLSISFVAADQSQIYVSPTGNDSWDGESPEWQIDTIIGPKATIKNATGTVANNGTVYIADGTYNENGISVNNKNVNFVGESRDNTIINGSNLGRIFFVGAQGAKYQYSFTNLTFANGNVTGNNGGAILNYGTTTINNCIFINNTASYAGGAILNTGTGSAPASLTVTDSYFINNRVTQGNGGAIYNGGLGPLTITNSDFSGNTASGTGSAIYAALSSPAYINYSRIIGTGSSLIAYQSGSYVDATYNWWGSNADPTSKVAAGVSVTPWLVLTTQKPMTLAPGTSSLIMANLHYDSWLLSDPDNPEWYYHDPANGHVPNGIPVTFAGDGLGSVTPLSGTSYNGLFITNFTAGGTTGISYPTFTVDTSGPVAANVTIANVIPTNLVVDPASGYNGDFLDIFATLTDNTDTPLSDLLVDFYVNGGFIGSALTDASGIASYGYYISEGAGIYPILVQFLGDTIYSGSSGTNNLNVDYIPTNIVVNGPADNYYRNSVNFTATLTDTINSLPIIDKKVYFNVNGLFAGVAVTNGLGIATLQYVLNQGATNYQVRTTFLGDEAYSQSNSTSNFNFITTPTLVTVAPKSGYYNNSVQLSANLTDTIHDIPISGRNITFSVNGATVGTALTNSLGTAVFTINPITLVPGTYVILAQFAGDLGYESSNGNENLIVNSTPTSLTAQAKTAYYNTTVALTATLRDAIKNAVMFNKTVNFKVNNVLVGSAVTNAQGIATFNYVAAIMPGTYQILAEFDATNEYNFSNGTNNLNVNYNPTTLNVAPKSGNHNGIVDLTATLRDTPNNLISGQTVYFSVNSNPVGSAVTNALGVATYQYTIDLDEGIYPINAEFLGDGGYNASSGLNNLTVSKTPTNITVDPVSGYYGDLVDLTATLTDNLHDVPINGRTVNFIVNNILIGSALTDLSGLATVSNYLISQNAGIYSIFAQFEGDNGFIASENSSSFVVNYIPISIVVEQVFGRTGDLVDLIATVTDLHNNLPVSGLNLNFTVNDNFVGSAATNASGVSTFPYAITLNQGSYVILAQFLQDYIFSGSTGTGTLIVNFPIPVASFTATPTSGRGPLTVKFTSTSTGTIDSYAWDFNNDGKVDSTLRNPSYTYTKAGVYTVKLTVTGPGGTRTQTRTNYINVKLPDIQMHAVYASTTVRRGNNIRIPNRVRNIGTISTGSFYVGFYLKASKTSNKLYFIGRRYISNLYPNSYNTRTNYFRIPTNIPRGRYYILAAADYTKRVREISRANNLKYTTTRTQII